MGLKHSAQRLRRKELPLGIRQQNRIDHGFVGNSNGIGAFSPAVATQELPWVNVNKPHQL
jgi:hypothetical protein